MEFGNKYIGGDLNKDYASILQSDGSPYGGNMDSQHVSDQSFDVPARWDGSDKAPRKRIGKPNIKEYTV